eukprot:TRINITY_DN11565_c0_g1_i1.p1 TRINITY_DN11565_c0_g1~~TRINITY_DN11565_c0_g1_i1.p1  ORF type:complete len:231 (-),score=64.77 TRINITY_DN11565_c0_g1_i1:34-726(-)
MWPVRVLLHGQPPPDALSALCQTATARTRADHPRSMSRIAMTPKTIIIKPLANCETGLTVGPASHWRCGRTVKLFMLHHILALLPAALLAGYSFGLPAVRVMAACGVSAVAAQWLCCRLMHRKPDVDNFGALYTGLLLSFLLPATAPWWLAIAGPAIAICLGQAVFGGLGQAPVNPVAVAWAVLTVSWPDVMDIDLSMACLLYTSDAADEEDSVDLGDRRMLQRKRRKHV